MDTNIFVYSFDQTSVVKAGKPRSQKGIISYQVVQEFFNVAIKRFSQPMKLADAEQYLGTVFRPLLAIHSFQSLYVAALQL